MSQVLRAVLTGQYPSGKNQIKLSAPAPGVIKRFPQKSFEKWRGTSYAQLDRQRGAWAKLMAPAKVTVRCFKGDLLRRDTAGIMDALGHLLEWCPAHLKKRRCPKDCTLPFILDDALLEEWAWARPVLDRVNPRVELTIEPFQGELP